MAQHKANDIRDSTRVLEGHETPATTAAARGFPGFPSYWQMLSSLFSFSFSFFSFLSFTSSVVDNGIQNESKQLSMSSL
jgi:hypothetical protein